MAREVGRGHHHQERVGFLGHLVDVGRELDAVHVEGHIGEVRRVVTEAFEILDTVFAAHIPQDG